MPRFSIIVGVYNQAKTLPGLIDSLRRQTFRDFEVHFCDDGSDDGAEQIIGDFWENENQDPNGGIAVYYHRQEHKGMRLARNINQGIKAAHGQYCLFIMADSMLELDYLEILNEYVQPDRVICGVRIQLAEIGGKLTGVDMDWRLKKNLVPEFPSVIVGLPWLCFTGNGLTIPTEALRLYGGWNETIEGYGGEDNEIVGRLFYKGYLCWSVPDLRLYHLWHKSQESNNKNSSIVNDLVRGYGS